MTNAKYFTCKQDDNGDFIGKDIAIPKNVVDMVRFSDMLVSMIHDIIAYNIECKLETLRNKSENEKLDINDRMSAKADFDDLTTLYAEYSAYTNCNAGNVRSPKNSDEKFTFACAVAIVGMPKGCGYEKIRNLTDDVLRFSCDIGNFKSDTCISDLKKSIISAVGSVLTTSNDSGIFKSFKIDGISNKQLMDIVKAVSTKMSWSNKGIVRGKVNKDAFTKELLLSVLATKFNFVENRTKKEMFYL